MRARAASNAAAPASKGRTAICEVLNLSDPIREMILSRRPTSEIKKTAHEEGMRFLSRVLRLKRFSPG
jgi:type II secretory ATPase GspE/PulE/Tfp pilus assembly ATPase PilB-like protein